MNEDVTKDLSDSAFDFQKFVWPKVKDKCGGGELIPMESITAKEIAKDFDILAGVDAWQIQREDSLIRGIASRVQWISHPYNSFTIRETRDSGVPTEYEKRQYVIDKPDKGYLFPALTIQAYLKERKKGPLLSVAVCRTSELFRYIEQWPKEIGHNRASNASFLIVWWKKYKAKGNHIYIWERNNDNTNNH